MHTNYDIILADRKIGDARVKREGLYYHISCRCHLSGNVIYKLVISCGDKQESLGVLVRKEDTFGLDTKLAVKRIGEGPIAFRVMPKHTELKGKFVPIRAEEPFAYIDKLQSAHLQLCSGQIGIIISEDDYLDDQSSTVM